MKSYQDQEKPAHNLLMGSIGAGMSATLNPHLPVEASGRKVRLLMPAIALVIAALLAGCESTPPAEEIFKPDSPTMLDIVERATRGKSDPALLNSHFGRSTGGDLDGYTRTQDTELSNLFPVIDNPRINVYVFPHITRRGDPVPGYTTAFYLYTQSGQFALPGEFHQSPGE